ncbi:hypothetical protein CCUS01_17030 [Colletotrichum cuscutae]|uniref:Uncharacterized protein n=1 Tax=Colletotrichum cuscutae TaxID=1209917 RepID=A0AAI9V753_9PEZI|nr:hypothetical protein CCUS01_17030 [Colletotrichum cuscutae]
MFFCWTLHFGVGDQMKFSGPSTLASNLLLLCIYKVVSDYRLLPLDTLTVSCPCINPCYPWVIRYFWRICDLLHIRRRHVPSRQGSLELDDGLALFSSVSLLVFFNILAPEPAACALPALPFPSRNLLFLLPRPPTAAAFYRLDRALFLFLAGGRRASLLFDDMSNAVLYLTVHASWPIAIYLIHIVERQSAEKALAGTLGAQMS